MSMKNAAIIRMAAALAVLTASSLCAGAEPPQAGAKPHAAVNLRAGPAATQMLFDEIAAADRKLFDAVFNTCDAKAVRELVADDFEFYHDKDGLNETSGAHFVDDIAKHCERIEKGVDFRARRELVKGSMAVYPLNNYGAVETGRHDFYAIEEGKPDRMTESAQFLHLWKKDGDHWKLTRVVSYDHKLAR
ncbi:MAG TPA: nuclear transport factor 2 family protein [Rudaea sp.]|nr:nuclear transport factor 2 family protein [Rudaea sp.]